MSGTAFEDAPSLLADDRWKLSAWIRQNAPEMIVSEDLLRAPQISVPGLLHRADRMLRALNDLHPRGQQIWAGDETYEKLIAIGWNRNIDDVHYMVESVLIQELAYLERHAPKLIHLTAKGLLYLNIAT